MIHRYAAKARRLARPLVLLGFSVGALAVLSACTSASPTPVPTYTPYPTFTPVPTQAPLPTYTPVPTQAPLPTYTPYPTTVVQPTATPAPGLGTIVVSADMVRGGSGAQGPTCALNSQYLQGEEVVFRVRLTDPVTGELLPESLSKLMADKPSSDALTTMSQGYKVDVQLSDGQTIPLKFGGHPGSNPVDYFWAGSWSIPANYPTGAMNYKVTAATPDGRSGTYEPYNVGSSKLTVVSPATTSLVVAADMVRGGAGAQGPTCVLTSQYQQGEEVVFRARITDAKTGQQIPEDPATLMAMDPAPTSEQLASSTAGMHVVVHLSDGQTIPLSFGGHPGRGTPVDYFWAGSWSIPANYPTGALDYYVTADWPSQGASGRWDPFNVGSSKLTIIAASTSTSP